MDRPGIDGVRRLPGGELRRIRVPDCEATMAVERENQAGPVDRTLGAVERHQRGIRLDALAVLDEVVLLAAVRPLNPDDERAVRYRSGAQCVCAVCGKLSQGNPAQLVQG